MQSIIKHLWLSTWPKLAVAFFGIAVYFFAVNFPEDAQGLLVNIAAGLISIPVIFLAYDLWNEKSHRRVNENAYHYAENEMGQIMLEMKRHMEELIYGYCVYFDSDDLIVDDSDFSNHVVRMKETSKILHDEEGEPYQLKYQMADYDEDESEDLYEIDKSEIVPVMADARYLGYQIVDWGIDDLVENLSELLKNYFVMKRLDDNESSVIVHLLESAKMLQVFMKRTGDNLFLPSDLRVTGFLCKVSETPRIQGELSLYSLFYSDTGEHISSEKLQAPLAGNALSSNHPYEQLLDEKLLGCVDKKLLMTVYVVNPDQYVILGDLITEILACIGDWRNTNAGGVVTDYEYGRIKSL